MLVRENSRRINGSNANGSYASDQLSPTEAKRGRIEKAAKLEGITIAEVMLVEKQREFRYLL